jgi:hypothetical protein
MIYTHVLARPDIRIVSPLDRLEATATKVALPIAANSITKSQKDPVRDGDKATGQKSVLELPQESAKSAKGEQVCGKGASNSLLQEKCEAGRLVPPDSKVAVVSGNDLPEREELRREIEVFANETHVDKLRTEKSRARVGVGRRMIDFVMGIIPRFSFRE